MKKNKTKSKVFPKERDENLREDNRALRQKIKQLEATILRIVSENKQLVSALAKSVDTISDYVDDIPVEDIIKRNKDKPTKAKAETVDDVKKRFREIYGGRQKDPR